MIKENNQIKKAKNDNYFSYKNTMLPDKYELKSLLFVIYLKA